MSDFDQTKLEPDDPRLTAFALGELEGEENARVAAAVAADPALQAAVEEIRDTAARLTAALETEPLPEPAPPVRIESYHTVRPPRLFRLPYWGMAALAAAACLTVVLTLRRLPGKASFAAGRPSRGGPIQLRINSGERTHEANTA